MTDAALHRPGPRALAPLFALTVFTGAGLVFMVEPMAARLVLPVLGGSSAVWNTSLAFFQAALLIGYVYAHALQRIGSQRTQMLIHLAVLAISALALPLNLTDAFGAPPPDQPALWLVKVLTVSLGAPFAALSATAPLLQAWQARTGGGAESGPWGLYAASNLGSLLALVAYPAIVEPHLGLSQQTLTWSLGFLVFGAMMAVLALGLWRAPAMAVHRLEASAAANPWGDRLVWTLLAALPSSLMLGVTQYVTTDVGSAPFLWVGPLALYLLTFVVAFSANGERWRTLALVVQAFSAPFACYLSRPIPHAFLMGVGVHFENFFLTALVCHQALVARRPEVARLTEFYVCMSLGGMLGGFFNAFVAPVAFNGIVEYPAVLVLACLARPWNRTGRGAWIARVGIVVCFLAVGLGVMLARPHTAGLLLPGLTAGGRAGLGTAAQVTAYLGAVLTLNRGVYFTLAMLAMVVLGVNNLGRPDTLQTWRGFYGVLRETHLNDPTLGGEVIKLSHGSTLHGAEALAPAHRCQPLLYYAHETPIGQVFDAVQAARPSVHVGAVGLGTGTTSAYDRAGDAFTYFEIDPLVRQVASHRFHYLSECAKGSLDFRMGDARLGLKRVADQTFDILLIDAFSSDSVPAHLMTLEAVKLYLAKVKPDGVVILHLSNRNLDLIGPAKAAARAAGAASLFQSHQSSDKRSDMWESSEDALILSPTPAGLAPFAKDQRWRAYAPVSVAPWTDDYTDLFGAMMRQLSRRRPMQRW
jgi:SAM-dependent methyltransferase